MENDHLSGIRNNYDLGRLDESTVSPDPFLQFETWMREALAGHIDEPTAMTLATASPEGIPSARIVLLKGFDKDGFVFFTNYESRKASELRQNDNAALVIYWKEMERQVRVEGKVEKTTEAESDAYFDSRPIGSQVGAIISPQSQVIPGREFLDRRRTDYLSNHEGINKRPGFWGGFRVLPSRIEFWQGRPDRLHDRILYRLEAGKWMIGRLAP